MQKLIHNDLSYFQHAKSHNTQIYDRHNQMRRIQSFTTVKYMSFKYW